MARAGRCRRSPSNQERRPHAGVLMSPAGGICVARLDRYVAIRRFTVDRMATAPPPRPDLTGLTILVVEDDRDSLDVLEMVLQSCGARVLTARNAAAAMAYIETAPRLDALVTDIAMPEIDGSALARRVRQHPKRSRLPIIAITAFYEEHGRQPEFDAYLRKPVDLDEVCAVVTRLAR